MPKEKLEVGAAKEVINIEFWGDKIVEIPEYEGTLLANNSYKTLRIVSEESSWMFAVWCTGEMELYNTTVGTDFLLISPHRPQLFSIDLSSV